MFTVQVFTRVDQVFIFKFHLQNVVHSTNINTDSLDTFLRLLTL